MYLFKLVKSVKHFLFQQCCPLSVELYTIFTAVTGGLVWTGVHRITAMVGYFIG